MLGNISISRELMVDLTLFMFDTLPLCEDNVMPRFHRLNWTII